MSRRSALMTLASALVVPLAAAGCSSTPIRPVAETVTPEPVSDVPAHPLVLLKVASGSGEPRQEGSAQVSVGIDTYRGGRVTTSPGRGGGAALDFPAFEETARLYPRAVVTVHNDTPLDQLNPGSQDLMWGADVKLDERSWSAVGVDNGDNIVQRGLSDEPALFKAEADHRHAACTVIGNDGTLIVRAPETLQPGRWYQVKCERSGDRLGVFVTEYLADGGSRQYSHEAAGPVGDIDFPDPQTPLTVGGKVGSDGRILKSATDQFNGSIDNPFLVLGRVDVRL